MPSATDSRPTNDRAALQARAEEFWLLLATGDAPGAQQAGEQLDVPFVTSPEPGEESPSAFSFQDVAADVETAVPVEGAGGGTPGEGEFATPRSVAPATPQGTLDMWNHSSKVGVDIVVRLEREPGQKTIPGVCAAKIGKQGTLDYAACARVDCDLGTHQTSKSIVPLPIGKEAIVIRTRTSSQAAKPKMFSRPFILWESLPTECQTEELREGILSLKFVARTWKFLFESYGGRGWMQQLLAGGVVDPKVGGVDPLMGSPIPSPRVGTGGFNPNDFLDPPSPSAPPPEDNDPDDDSLTVESVTEQVRVSPRGARSSNPFWDPPSVSHRFETAGAGDTASVPSLTRSEARGEFSTFTARRIQALETRTRLQQQSILDLNRAISVRDQQLREAFEGFGRELEVTKQRALKAIAESQRAIEQANARPPPPPIQLPTPMPTQSVAPPQSSPPATPWTDPLLFQQFVSRISSHLNLDQYLSDSDLKARLASLGINVDTGSTESVSSISRRIAKCEVELFKPEGALAVIRDQVKLLEERRNANVIERGNQLFKDQQAVRAWVQLLDEPNVFRYCVDMLVLVILTQDPYEDVAGGMATEAAAYKAQYNDMLEARISISHGLTFPDNLVARSSKAEASLTEGWFWASGWTSHTAFEGTYNNGAMHRTKKQLEEVTKMIQNAINFAYPTDVAPIPNAVFSEQLRTSYTQAVGFIDSINPLFKTLQTSGMSDKEAWGRIFVFVKSVFEDIATVRKVSAVRDASAMIWGSFATAELLKEYERLRWVQHPQVSATLALTAMQREGKNIQDALAAKGNETAASKKNADAIKKINEVLKKNNLQ